MFAGVEPAEVIRDMGNRGTHGVDLIRWLRDRGFILPNRPQRFVGYSPDLDPRPRLPATAIVRVDFTKNRRRTHWILWAEGRFWDPSAAMPDETSSLMSLGVGRIYSILPVEREAAP
jgi:hypothetical protein